jgi:glycosyltransferase involved in cell wall biosynthesis
VWLWARNSGVTTIADVVEWYSPRQFRGGFASPSWLSAQLSLRLAYPQFDAVIAISEYLAGRYGATHRPAIVVPPTLDTQGIAAQQVRPKEDKGRRRLTVCYFGSPGKKDLLPEIVRGFSAARSARPDIDFVLRIAGPQIADVRDALDGHVPDGVQVVGRLPHDEVGAFVRSADFSLLLRPQATYSRAGFPTKFVESLANSTPVIANHTSDLARYLTDGGAGLVVEVATAEALASTLDRAASITSAQLGEMRENAREIAMTRFDFRNYVAEVDALLSGSSA